MNIELKTGFTCKNFICSVTFLLLLIPSISASAIYKWVDENGKTHYGSQRPNTNQSERLKIKVKRPIFKKDTEKDGDENAEGNDKQDNKDKLQPTEAEAKKIKGKEKARLCNQAVQEAQRIEARGRIRARDKNGNVRYLTDKERGNRLSNAKKDVKRFCR